MIGRLGPLAVICAVKGQKLKLDKSQQQPNVEGLVFFFLRQQTVKIIHQVKIARCPGVNGAVAAQSAALEQALELAA